MNHDAISVQMCRDAGLDDVATDALLTRISSRLITRRRLETEARRVIEAFETIGNSPHQFVTRSDKEAAQAALIALKAALEGRS